MLESLRVLLAGMHSWSAFAGWVADGLALTTSAYALLRFSAARQQRITIAANRPRPAISVLKPLHGEEPGQYENLRTFFAQRYPEFQLVFGVRDAQDPALAVVARLCREYPACDVAVVIDPRRHGSNPKVSNLINMLPVARHALLVIADADIHAPLDYLDQLATELAPADVGIVTCLYHGLPQANIWSRLGTQFIDDWFAPSVRVAHTLGSRNYGFGATIALRRSTLQAIGGFEVLVNHLADDWWLSNLTREQGLRTVLSGCEVGTLVNEPTVAALIDHERRWMHTIRVVQPLAYSFLFITFTLPTALICAAIGGGLAKILLLVSALLRLGSFQQAQRSARRRTGSAWLLLPLRDALTVWVWLRGFVGQQLRWRDQEFAVNRGGVLDISADA